MSINRWVSDRIDQSRMEGIDYFSAYIISGVVVLWGLWALAPWWWDAPLPIWGEPGTTGQQIIKWTCVVPVVFGTISIIACKVRSFRLLSSATFVLACFWTWNGVIYAINLIASPAVVLYFMLAFIYGYGYLGLKVHAIEQDRRNGVDRGVA